MKIFSILALTVVSASAATNIIDATHGIGAGSFELGTYSQNSGNASNYMRLASGSTTMTGWVIGGADGIDWMTIPSHSSHNGLFMVDLGGVSNLGAPSVGSVTTTIPTTVGATYDISFVSYRYGPDPVTGVVTAGDLNQEFSPGSTLDTVNPTWTFFEYSFTAISESTDITFATFNSGGFSPTIDNVVVVPEASTVVLGLFGLAFAMRRNRNR